MRNKHHSGFTLIELMVVVAIITTLAAIGAPVFLKILERHRQAEVTAGLRGAFAALTSAAAERGDLRCGWCGWTPGSPGTYNYGYQAMVGANKLVTKAFVQTEKPLAACASQLDFTGASLPRYDDEFTIVAVGNIDTDVFCDQWLIDDREMLDWRRNDLNDAINTHFLASEQRPDRRITP